MDYEQFLSSINMDDVQVSHLMSELPDPVMPEFDTIYPIFSKIHGVGLASTENYDEAQIVLFLLEGGERQVGARYTNHSTNPNLTAAIMGSDLIAVAVRPIKAGEELTMCYSDNMKKSLELLGATA